MRTRLALRLQEKLEQGEVPEPEWDRQLWTGEVWPEDLDTFLSVGPVNRLGLDKG